MGGSLALRDELTRARAETDMLFRLLAPDAIYDRPIAARHRLIFYLGHLEAFDWNLLGSRISGEPSFRPSFDALFERGIDPPPGKALSDQPADWPSRTEVELYNLQVRGWIDQHLEDMDPEPVQMVIEHRYMHAETLAYLLHELPYDRKIVAAAGNTSGRPSPPNTFIPIKPADVTMGQPEDRFGWDNERKAHRVQVGEFQVAKYKVTNGDYLDFVREGGPVPHFWKEEPDGWHFRGMFGATPLPLDHPVWATWEQASAYADWTGAKLLSEAQFVAAAALTSPDPARDNFNFYRFDPLAVDNGHERTNGHAPVQLIGNGWEWTRDVFAPFDGFEPHPFYAGYSADFFDGEHYIMKGASPRTANSIARPSFRNWFRPEYPYMYAAFRTVED